MSKLIIQDSKVLEEQTPKIRKPLLIIRKSSILIKKRPRANNNHKSRKRKRGISILPRYSQMIQSIGNHNKAKKPSKKFPKK